MIPFPPKEPTAEGIPLSGDLRHRAYITIFYNFSQSKPPLPCAAFSFGAAELLNAWGNVRRGRPERRGEVVKRGTTYARNKVVNRLPLRDVVGVMGGRVHTSRQSSLCT